MVARPVLMTLQDGQVIRYRSVFEASQNLGISEHKIRDFITTGRVVDKDWARVTLVYEDGLPVDYSKHDGDMVKKSINKSVFKTNTRKVKMIASDGTTTEYESIREASRRSGLSVYMVKKSLKEAVSVKDGYWFTYSDSGKR